MLKKDLSILFLLVSCLTLGCSQADQQSQGQEKKSAISFETTEYDYGNIMQGSDGTCAFVFTNTGDAPLLLTNVRSSCGCTIPEWPKKPIRPGRPEIARNPRSRSAKLRIAEKIRTADA